MFRRLNHCAVRGYAPICLDTNDDSTVASGFKQRLLRKTPTPDSALLEEFKVFVAARVRQLYKPVRRMEFEEWLESTTYNDARKGQLRQANELLRGGRPTKKQRQHVDAFPKTEHYPVFKHCRLINSRSDAFKVWSGPMFKAIENEVYSDHWFIKHVPVPDRPALIKQMRKVGYRYWQTDFTAYESHFNATFMDACECELYRWCL